MLETFTTWHRRDHVLTLGIGTALVIAASPRSSIMFLMSIERSATCRSIVQIQQELICPAQLWWGALPTVTSAPSLLTRVILVDSAAIVTMSTVMGMNVE